MTAQTITIDAGTLLFNEEDNTSTGLLIPTGVVARSNLGEFTANADSFEVPDDVTGLTLNVEHNREQPVGAVTKLWHQPEGLFASFKFSKTAEGQKAFNDAREGKRKHLSVEASGVRIRDGVAVAGRIFAAALVERPAFAGATLLAAEDTELADQLAEGDQAHAERLALIKAATDALAAAVAGLSPQTPEDTESEDPETNPIPTPEDPAEQETEVETLPDTLHANAVTPVSAREFFALNDRARAGIITGQQATRRMEAFAPKGTFQTSNNLYAALSDVTYDAVGAPKPYQDIPQWLGDVYAANPYRQQVADLIAHGDLTGKKMAGYRWVVKPAGATYAGNKAEVSSNVPTTEAFEAAAVLWAGAHDIDIQHRLFGDDGYTAAHVAMMIESYKKWVDAKVIADLLAGATGSVTDAGIGGVGTAISSIVDGALAVVAAGYTPTFALVTPAVYREYILTKENDLPALLSQSAGLEEGSFAGFTVRPTTVNLGTNRNALVGASSAATLYELGGVPLRVDGVDVAHMGDDIGFIGAAAVAVTNPTALVKVTKKA